MEITFENKIENISLQVGDNAYYVTNHSSGYATNTTLIGEITEVKDFSIVIALPVNPPSPNDFIMFSKNTVINNSSLLGYYAEVKLLNESTKKAELFALGSEITQSSK